MQLKYNNLVRHPLQTVNLYTFQPSPPAASGGESTPNAQINLDLTTPIRVFCELVMRSAIAIKLWKDGMRVSKSTQINES